MATAPTKSKKANAKKPAAKPVAKSAAMPTANPTVARMSLAETMRNLAKAGNAQARKTYARHGAQEPMFGVSFATLKTMVKRIRVDHELALALWDTGNHDARVLAMKIAEAAKITPMDLDRWARETTMNGCGMYVAALAAESPHGAAKGREWLASPDPALRAAGWTLCGYLSNLNEKIPDEWFAARLEHIEKSIHTAANADRLAMNSALIRIGGRSSALRKAAIAAAKRIIGRIEVDHGDTSCKTPDAIPYIEKMWAHATAKKFPSPAAQERARESMRTRC